MAQQQCHAEQVTYNDAVVSALKQSGVYEPYSALLAARETKKRLMEASLPQARSLGREKHTLAPPNWA
jgi:hypothetical protein